MRLTLRTLLAYLDDILDRADAEELAAKIRESDFASGLVHRIRNAVGRLRLSAPQVLGRGLAADANTVAEYLDNTLPSERVPDFEKVCLESDMHLAEVASCHEILTLVLAEPVTAEQELKERIVGLGQAEGGVARKSMQRLHRVDQGIASSKAGEGAATTRSTEMGVSTKSAIGAGDGDAGRRSTAAWWLVASVLVVAVVLALMTFPRGERLTGTPETPETPGTPGTPGSPGSPGTPGTPGPQGTSGETTVPHPVNGDFASATHLAGEAPSENGPGKPTTAPSVKSVSPEAPEEGLTAAPSEPANSAWPESELPTDRPPLPKPDEIVAAADQGGPGEMPDAEQPAAHSPGPDREDLPVVAQEGSAGAEKALQISLMADQQLVALASGENPTWQRTQSKETLVTGTRMLVLEPFRSRITLDREIELTVFGPSQFAFPGTQNGKLEFGAGRFGVANSGEGPHTIHGTFAGEQFELRLPAPNTLVFLEFQARVPSGADPSQGARVHYRNFWVVKGSAEVLFGEGPPHGLDAGQSYQQVDDVAPLILPDGAPDWSHPAFVRPIERQGARLMEPLIPSGEPLEAALMGAFADRRTDVRSLASRNLAWVGIYKPLVQTFYDPRFHAYWRSHYQCLRQRIQQDAEQARAIRDAVLELDRVDGQWIYRILWGFDNQQLEDGAARKLVNSLESPNLAVRAFAIEALREITGTDARYRPDYHSNRRKDVIQGWQRRLTQGDIRRGPESDFGR